MDSQVVYLCSGWLTNSELTSLALTSRNMHLKCLSARLRGSRYREQLLFDIIHQGKSEYIELLIQHRCFPEVTDLTAVCPTVIQFLVRNGVTFPLHYLVSMLSRILVIFESLQLAIHMDHRFKCCSLTTDRYNTNTVKIFAGLLASSLPGISTGPAECCDIVAKFKILELVKICFARGGFYTEKALRLAAKYHAYEVFVWLIETYGFTPTAKFFDYVVMVDDYKIDIDGQIRIFMYLLDHGFKIQPSLGRKFAESLLGNAFIWNKLHEPKWEVLRALAKYGIKPKILQGAVAEGTCRFIKLPGVRKMLENGVYPYLVKKELACAIKEHRHDLINLFARYGVRSGPKPQKVIIHHKA